MVFGYPKHLMEQHQMETLEVLPISYGTNGFHLKFNPADFNTSGGDQTVTYNGNSSTLPDNHVADVSGSGNHWEIH